MAWLPLLQISQVFDYTSGNNSVEKAFIFVDYKTYKLLDRGIIEKLGPFGLMNFFYNNALKINFLQTGLIYHSALVMLIGVISLFMVVGFFSFFSVFFNIYLINIFVVLIFFTVYIDNKYNIKL